MKIRWVNTEIKPATDSEWMLFVCKFPFLFLIPMLVMAGFGVHFWQILTEFENGERESVFVGKLKLLYDIFGKWGVSGFFIFLALCFYYLFWVYAIRQPNSKNKFF
jgi:hypothetical protein